MAKAVEMNVVTAMKKQASTNRLIRPSPFLEKLAIGSVAFVATI